MLSVSPQQRFKTVGDMTLALSSLVGSARHVVTMRPPSGVGIPAIPPPAAGPPIARQPTLMWGATSSEPVVPLVATVPRVLPSAGPPRRPGESVAPAASIPGPQGLPHFDPFTDEDADDDELPTRAITREQLESNNARNAAQRNPAPAAGRAASFAQPPYPTRPSGVADQTSPPSLVSRQPAQPSQNWQPRPPQLSIFGTSRNVILPAFIAGGIVFFALMIIVLLLIVFRPDRSGTTNPAATVSVVIAPTPSATTAATVPAAASTAASSAAAPTPDAAVAAVVKTTLVRITCTPDCEEISCDGKGVDSPATGVALEAGKHSCTGAKKGYTAKSEAFEVKGTGDSTDLVLRLSRIAVGGGYTPPPTTVSKPAPPPAKTCGTFINPCK